MKIIAASKKVGDILKDRMTYVVPRFQRNYAWEKEQISDLWDDLISTAAGDEDYFIGSMVFTPHKDKNKTKILDGQQRLATILLLLSALKSVLKEFLIEGSKEWIEEINRIAYTIDISTLSKNPKLELNREDKKFFEEVILNERLINTNFKSHKRIENAYKFFKNRLKEGIEKEGSEFVKKVLNALFDKFLLIEIQVDSDVNAHIIFETLNDRGLELSVSDLVKNYIFSISGDKNLNDVMRMWEDMINTIGDLNVTKFFRHFWLSKYKLVRKDDIYKEIKSRVTSYNVKKFMEVISEDAVIYSNLKNPSHEFWGDEIIEDLLDELNTLKAEQVYILLLALYRKFYDDNKKIFVKMLKLLINFTMRYNTICKFNPNELERLYSSLSIKLRNDEIKREDVEKEIRKFSPPEEQFLECFKSFETKNSKLAKYILFKINDYLMEKDGKREVTADIRKTNLEHIIPQKPDNEWIEFFKKNGIEHESLVHKIGNMTILLKEYNKKISNKFFNVKKEMYRESDLPLNKFLAELDMFGPKELSDRQKIMAQIANKIWNV